MTPLRLLLSVLGVLDLRHPEDTSSVTVDLYKKWDNRLFGTSLVRGCPSQKCQLEASINATSAASPKNWVSECGLRSTATTEQWCSYETSSCSKLAANPVHSPPSLQRTSCCWGSLRIVLYNWLLELMLQKVHNARSSEKGEGEVRLVGGSGPHAGYVEVLHYGAWGTVCSYDNWDLQDATVVCRQLGYGRAVAALAAYGGGSGPIWYANVRCNGSEASLTQCAHRGLGVHNCDHSRDAGVFCSNIQLVGGSGPHEGRVEVYHNGTRGTVCDDDWNLQDATVVCRQLGYFNATAALGSTKFGAGSGPILFSELACIGNESIITECHHLLTGVHNCTHSEDVGVVCEVATVRLAGGSSDAEGRVEVYINGEWGTVCGYSWDPLDSKVVCQQLGYKGVNRTYSDTSQHHFSAGTGQSWLGYLLCTGSEASLLQCPHYGVGSGCSHYYDVGVVCTNEDLPGEVASVRLAGGSSEAEGRVEVYISGEWGTVCGYSWDPLDSEVVCQQLGYKGVNRTYSDTSQHNFGEGTGQSWLRFLLCTGSEANLLQCPHGGVGSGCPHSYDVGVVCTIEDLPGEGDIRLVGGSDPSEGRVELFYEGEWRRLRTVSGRLVIVVPFPFENATVAPVACRQAGYPYSEGLQSFGQGSGPVWLFILGCIGDEERLEQCLHNGWRSICSLCADFGVRCRAADKPPFNVSVEATPFSVSIEWAESPDNLPVVTGYIITMVNVVTEAITTVYIEGSSHKEEVSGLTPFTEYSFTVTAEYKYGAGPPSETVTQRTKEHVPSPPRSLMAVEVGSSTASLTWLPPTEPNGILLFYQLVARQVEGNTEDILVDVPANMSTADLSFTDTSSANTLTSDMVEVTANRSNMSLTNTTEDLPMTSTHVAFTLSGLSPHTDYVITVVANTSAGYGNRSEELRIQTKVSIVGIMASVIVTAIGIAGLAAGIATVSCCVYIKWRKKTTASVGGTQDHGSTAPKAAVSGGARPRANTPPPVQEVAAPDFYKWEMGYKDLVLRKQIGSGQGGIVLLGCLKREGTSKTVTDYIAKERLVSGCKCLLVAVKRFRGERMRLELDHFRSELAVMMKVSTGAHPNVIRMVGCIPEVPYPAVVMEYAPLGNLHNFLLRYKNQRLPTMLPDTVAVSSVSHVETEFQDDYNTLALEPQDVLTFAQQIASGMEFLASMNILHRDLACRNILLSYDKVLKLADFGLSREADSTYISKSVCNLPVRWMAPESVFGRRYTKKSDVWSFGVVLWEICTLGQLPYNHLANSDAAKAISTGEKLTKPQGCSPELYSVMTDNCWKMDPDKRATFSQLKSTLDRLLAGGQDSPPVNLDCELQQQAREVRPTTPPTQYRASPTPEPTRGSSSEAPATLTCWSDPDPESTGDAPQGDPSTSPADVAEGCSPPTAVNSLTVTAEIHPLSPNALECSALHTPTASLPAPTLTCSSDVDPLPNEDTAHDITPSCDPTSEDCQFAVPSTAGDDLEITPYSCVTLVNVEVHPLPPPTVEDKPDPSAPQLASPNVVVTLPSEGEDSKETPTHPPPRGRRLATGNKWEMHYVELNLDQPLGSGKFGTVVRGTLRKDDDSLRCAHPVARLEKGQGGSDHQWRVAVKQMTDAMTEKGMEAFYNEVAIMKRVSVRGHPHVITMVGYIPRGVPPAIVMEFAPLSTLLKFLMKIKDDHTTALNPGSVKMPPPAEIPEELKEYYASLTMEPSDVLSFGYQIASGMEFLIGLGILHRDLASRNILMTIGKYLKLADFGLSRETKEVYVSQCFSNLPFRWMAPEALHHNTYTEKTDVWSFGVVLWEICTLGRLPYCHVRAEHVEETIISGGKLPQPDGCHPVLYRVMTDNCWEMKPEKRATFPQLKKIFDRFITSTLDHDGQYMDVNCSVQEQLREEISAFLAIAPWAAPPPATAEACDTMPGDDDACTDVVPAPEAEGARVLAVSSQQEELAAEAIPLEEVNEPVTIIVVTPSESTMERVTDV